MYPQEGTGDVLYLLRLAFSTAMVAGIVLGFAAIRRREIARHRAWMIQACAIALAAGTQAFTVGGGALFGDGVLAHDLSIASAWHINLAVAESAVRRRPAPRRRPQPAVVGAQP
jgi:uncharacterized membrane protein YozB (DUF420 family)